MTGHKMTFKVCANCDTFNGLRRRVCSNCGKGQGRSIFRAPTQEEVERREATLRQVEETLASFLRTKAEAA